MLLSLSVFAISTVCRTAFSEWRLSNFSPRIMRPTVKTKKKVQKINALLPNPNCPLTSSVDTHSFLSCASLLYWYVHNVYLLNQIQREKKRETGAAVDRISESLTTGPEANDEEAIETGRTASETKKRKRHGDEAKNGNRREGGRVAVLDDDGDSDGRVHGHVGGEGEKGGEGSTPRTNGRGKKKKKVRVLQR